ncbi:MAG: hypothetical protein WCV68_01675 [Candidatus Paceibacterota bacterium]
MALMRMIYGDLLPELLKQIADCNSRLPADQRRYGGYLSVFAADQDQSEPPLAVIRVGDPTKEKMGKYYDLCLEKGRRLLAHPGHLSSWQSRNVAKEQYGGAMCTPDFVLGFSGHTELGDEAILVNACFAVGMLPGSTAAAIASYSLNNLIVV